MYIIRPYNFSRLNGDHFNNMHGREVNGENRLNASHESSTLTMAPLTYNFRGRWVIDFHSNRSLWKVEFDIFWRVSCSLTASADESFDLTLQ